MGALLIASAGGHLQQLHDLRSRLDVSEALWVTYPVVQTESLLSAEQVIYAHHPTTKNLANAVRNYRLSGRVLARRDIKRVISTGAAVAIPFMIRARQLRIPCHYIESATRTTGPSLTGRILGRVPGVHLYRQLGEWGEPRWRRGPCVFDGIEVAEAIAQPIRHVFVSLGTHHFPFPALVDRFRGSIPPEIGVTWQLGPTSAPPGLRGRIVGQLPVDDLDRQIRAADVVVGHAGTGLALACLRVGKVPVLVPRRRFRREHTDDHQYQFARTLGDLGLAITTEVGTLSYEHLERAVSLVATHDEPPPFELVD